MELSINGRFNVQEMKKTRSEFPNLLGYAKEKRDLGSFNDINICAGNVRLPANKMVLSHFSLFFEKLFEAEMKEKYQDSVLIDCIDGITMENIINYLYSGEIFVKADNVCNLISAADYLQIDDLKQFAFDFLQSGVTPDNCFLILKIALVYQGEDLMDAVKLVIGERFDEVAQSDDFLNLSTDELIDFISEQDRRQVKETSLYNAVIGWTKHEEENRDKDFYDVIQRIKLHKLPSDFLKEVVVNEKLMTNNFKCFQLLNQALVEHTSELQIKATGSKILLLGGLNLASKVREVFNCTSEVAKEYPDLPDGRHGGSSVAMNNIVYFIGGKIPMSGNPSDLVWKMDLRSIKLEWQQLDSMTNPRQGAGVTIFKDALVVYGGFNGKTTLQSGEYYSAITRKWIALPNMNYQRSWHSTVTCNDRLYAIGGFANNQYRSVCECIEAGWQRWENIAPMQTSRVRMGAVNYNGFIYVMGGRSGKGKDTRLKNAERYDVENNKWSPIVDMAFTRDGCAACVLQGKIYAVGGIDEHGHAVKKIECYDPVVDQWDMVETIDYGCYEHSIVVI